MAQVINSGEGTLESYFDTVLLPLTTIPLLGFWKLLPTFGGRIITIATEVRQSVNTLHVAQMWVQTS